ncbi:unnamed protein product [Ambrosiozyma monospora]|uniref:Unnamed protein product n=1 Tax=Ambrosiozyma monospora TaxID=43982 RepID=A0ACB5UDH3_AMBMO|nr:unnamed protein product [Ambrosiozyma monospora]
MIGSLCFDFDELPFVSDLEEEPEVDLPVRDEDDEIGLDLEEPDTPFPDLLEALIILYSASLATLANSTILIPLNALL